MPRPPVKRSKVNHPNQAIKRAPDPDNYTRSSPATRRRQQLEEQLAYKLVGQVPSDSDDSDLLVTRVKHLGDRKGAPRLDVYGSGGVAQGDKPAAHKSQSNSWLRASSKGGYGSEERLNEYRKNAPTQPRVDRPSMSRAPTPATSGSPASVRAPPSAVKSSNVSGLTGRGRRAAEVSILGPIKIRKRQPSILRSIGSPHSSILDQEFGDFLPDDESTPLNRSRKRKLSSPPRASSTALPAQSQPQADDFNAATINPSSAEPDLPPAPSGVASETQQPASTMDSDIMALPNSSSSSPTPAWMKDPSPPRNKRGIGKAKVPKSLSTSALQALMPARRRQRNRRDRATRAVDEFDILFIATDTNSDAEESYVASPRPTKKTGKPQKRKSARDDVNPNTKHSQVGKPREGKGGGSIGRSRRRKFSTQPSSPSIPRGATTAAKTSSQQQRQHQHQQQEQQKQPVRTYSRRIGRGGTKATEAEEEDKENRPSTLSGGSSKRTKGQALEDPGEQLPASLPDHNGDDQLDIDTNVGRRWARTEGDTAGGGGGGQRASVDEPEQAKLARKFKEVDEWELEFEDVTFDGSAGDWS